MITEDTGNYHDALNHSIPLKFRLREHQSSYLRL